MTDFTKRSTEEAKTHELLAGFECETYYSTTQCLKMAIRAMWAHTVSVEELANLGALMGGLKGLDMTNVNSVISRMIRAKVLRKRIVNGVYSVEVNY